MMRLLTNRPWRALNHLTPIAYPKTLIPRRPYSSSRISKPLRILFAGSDEFSCTSLRAIHAEHLRNPELIASIDVLHQPPKKAGRGQSQLRFVPIIALARELGIPTHTPEQCWTPEKLTLPTWGKEPINLIIAVSFGLFIPRRLLEAVEYGGLNIHPSLLPNYRGAAPLQHALINGSKKTGITLQTLSPTSFDRGLILSQTPPLPILPTTTYTNLLEEVSPKAASLLLSGLKSKLYIPPLIDISPFLNPQQKGKLKLAPKITSKDSEINWITWDASALVRRQNALGRLWSTVWKPLVPIPALPSDHIPSEKVHNFTYSKKQKPRSAHLIFQPHFQILSQDRVREILRDTRKESSGVGEFKVYETLFSNPSDLSTSSTSLLEPPLQTIHWFNNNHSAILLHAGAYIQVPKLILGGQTIGNGREVLLPFSRRVRDLWAHSLEENERFLDGLVGQGEVDGEGEEEDWEGGRFVRRVKANVNK